jgi:phosphoribosylglycinamide formyltransferase-1
VNVRTITSREFVNLLVDLDERFSPKSTQRAIAYAREAGYTLADAARVDERYLSWIDLVFDETLSAQAATGSAILLAAGDRSQAGFAAYGGRNSRPYWLRAWENREDVGVLGPFGIAPAHRTPGLESALIAAALGTMRAKGYRHALIPAVREPLPGDLVSTTGARVVERFCVDRGGPGMRTTVLASGGGTNFQAVIDAVGAGLALDLRALVVNRPDAFAIKRANRADIPVYVHAWNRGTTSRRRYDEDLIEIVARTEPDLVLMLGWMHLVSEEFVERFPETINIHPAFLPHDVRAETVTMPDGAVIPAFRGAHAIRDAIRAGSSWYGATAHRVVAETDRGPVLKRLPVPLVEREEERALAALRPAEHAVLIGAIRRVLAER